LQLRFEARNQTRHDCGNITTGASQGLRQHECRDQSEAPRAQTALNHFKRSRVCLTVEHRNRHRTEEHGAGFYFWRMTSLHIRKPFPCKGCTWIAPSLFPKAQNQRWNNSLD
jgi:hypothetical protein